MENKSLFERIGGKAAIDAAVDIFYAKILEEKLNMKFEPYLRTDEHRTKLREANLGKIGSNKGTKVIIDSQGKRRQWISQYSYTKKYLENKSNILEIGSGAGQTIYWFDQIGFSVTGIEPDARNVELINKKLTKSKCQAGFFEDINKIGRAHV